MTNRSSDGFSTIGITSSPPSLQVTSSVSSLQEHSIGQDRGNAELVRTSNRRTSVEASTSSEVLGDIFVRFWFSASTGWCYGQSFISRVEDLFSRSRFAVLPALIATATGTTTKCVSLHYYAKLLCSSSNQLLLLLLTSTARYQDAAQVSSNASTVGCFELLQGVLVFHYVTISRHLYSFGLLEVLSRKHRARSHTNPQRSSEVWSTV